MAEEAHVTLPPRKGQRVGTVGGEYHPIATGSL